MAETILAASCAARNDSVLELVRIFERVLEYVVDHASDYNVKSSCLQSLETLLDYGYRAVKQNGIYTHITNYQKHLQSYIYHSSTYFGKEAQTPRLALDDHASKMAQSLVNMLIIAADSFEQIGYPSYYQDFAHAVKTLLECVGGYANLSQDAAGLVLAREN